jgi:uncharacterized protein YbjT (DUF2867 family)
VILVTGGTGGIGSELLRLLSRAGVPARALTRNLQKVSLPRLTPASSVVSRSSKMSGSLAS